MKLNAENYYSQEANKAYMSVSQFKDFYFECEAQALAKVKGEYSEPRKECFLLGAYVHAAIEGEEAFNRFRDENPAMFSSRGSTKGEVKADYKRAEQMLESLRKDPLCMRMLTGKKETIVTTELFGVKWKARIDVLNEEEGHISDLKYVKELHSRHWNKDTQKWESFVEHYGYVLQMAVYTELERIHNRRFERLEPFIVAVSKEEVPDKEIICFDDEALEIELQKVREHLPRVMAVKNGSEPPRRCEKCRYCKQTKKSKIVHYLNLLEV